MESCARKFPASSLHNSTTPRLRGIISITRVSATSDLRSARVYVSVMGSEEVRQQALSGIQSSASYLRRELRSRVSLRYVPFLTFVLDDAMLEANRLMHIIDDLGDATASPDPAASRQLKQT